MKQYKMAIMILTIAAMMFGTMGLAAADSGVTEGKTMIPFTLMAPDGSTVTVQPSDKVTVINFWATWCPPCRSEMPDLNTYALQNSSRVNFYAVNIQENASSVNAFMQGNGYTMPVLLDISGQTARTYRINAIPTTLVIDRSGVIVLRKVGTISMEQLEATVNNL